MLTTAYELSAPRLTFVPLFLPGDRFNVCVFYLMSVLPEGSLLCRCCQSGFALWTGLKSCSRCTGPGPFHVRVSGTD